MRLTRREFIDWPQKAITLLGMSGVGKTTLANKLPMSSWFHYSGDYRIGTKYLEEPILDNIKRQAMQVDFLRDLLRSDSIYIASNITVHNLEPVSTFLGKVGKRDLGGLPLDEFKRRQRLHMKAETEAMRDVADFISKAQDIYGYAHFINDAGGSICELDQKTLEILAEKTLILYIRAGSNMEEELISRARANPKPLYYGDDFLDAQLAEYLKRAGLRSADQIEPDSFVQWIFPKLVAHRRPRYQKIAEQYGYTVDNKEVAKVTSEADFYELIGDILDHSPSGTVSQPLVPTTN